MPTSGSYEQVEGRPLVRFERTFPHPVAAVWDAVTDPRRLGDWFPTSVEFAALRAGEPITFRFPEDRYPAMRGVVREVRAPERLVFTWGDDELTFELAAADGGSACRRPLRSPNRRSGQRLLPLVPGDRAGSKTYGPAGIPGAILAEVLESLPHLRSFHS